ncbi:unnamed protein product [Angiostrongylus costaricensis]|uniref:Uncharacterized protein n=1 Tax=Angiostrongylus costaricensis TaxID=334426 RepID=A0A0R3PPE1_ANGCS|nr:unnamed protein product [Angiostrongylus costaricensis]
MFEPSTQETGVSGQCWLEVVRVAVGSFGIGPRPACPSMFALIVSAVVVGETANGQEGAPRKEAGSSGTQPHGETLSLPDRGNGCRAI